jgi:uncharacterized protein (DUF362 family)
VIVDNAWNQDRQQSEASLAKGAEVNTNPLLVGAAVHAFLEIGAKEVVVAESPGHQRDTYLVVVESGLGEQLRLRRLRFVRISDQIQTVALWRRELTRTRAGSRVALD